MKEEKGLNYWTPGKSQLSNSVFCNSVLDFQQEGLKLIGHLSTQGSDSRILRVLLNTVKPVKPHQGKVPLKALLGIFCKLGAREIYLLRGNDVDLSCTSLEEISQLFRVSNLKVLKIDGWLQILKDRCQIRMSAGVEEFRNENFRLNLDRILEKMEPRVINLQVISEDNAVLEEMENKKNDFILPS